ncbi:glycosyl hydrolase family 45 [Colletotrichum orchidophilum]|uniref:cellulase n=1 Tax=Colletotrichum orchidophilum TaxID=1209926 RepID=A0A1G4AX77_9PEZI|nr:glycosyl hydrolase family 45 [Colletotrichum orchidophilum]OHE93693.1 glycosyl hydrolase family 45 [Colletotrichum orchidophilum]
MQLAHPLTLLFPLVLPSTAQAQSSGTGSTTHYWDCCKHSCAWLGKTSSLAARAGTICDRDDNPLSDGGATCSGCDPGSAAYMCSAQSPWLGIRWLCSLQIRAIPGGGVGQFDACTDQYGAPANGWGQRYGGVSSRAECDGFPAKSKAGCYWRFYWFKGINNPSVSFRQVTCPAEITTDVRSPQAIGSSDIKSHEQYLSDPSLERLGKPFVS